MKKQLILLSALGVITLQARWTDNWNNPYADVYGFEQKTFTQPYEDKFAPRTFDKEDYQYEFFDPNLDKYGYQPKEYEPNESEYNSSATPSSSYYKKKTVDELTRSIGPVYQQQ